MQLSVKSVFSAVEGAIGGGTIIPFILTTALDLVRATDDKYVQGTRVTLNHIEEYPRAYQIWNKAVNARIHIMSLYKHIRRVTSIV